MNRIRLLVVGTVLLLALTVVAQQAATQPDRPTPDHPVRDGHGQGMHDGVPTVEGHLKVLTEKLALTGDQQTKTRPILQELHDATQKLMQDETMSREERLGKVRACREKADKKIREILNDDQKKKLDQLEQEPNSGLHGNVNGATPPPPTAGATELKRSWNPTLQRTKGGPPPFPSMGGGGKLGNVPSGSPYFPDCFGFDRVGRTLLSVAFDFVRCARN
jgi:Spy/CpxP family protein refolding chaperone